MFAFTRPGDETGQASAHELGAEWARDSLTPPPEELDAAIIFASAAGDFFALAPRIPVRTDVHPYALADAGRALKDLRAGRFQSAAVIALDM